jgi:hypothetical protein
MSFFTNAAAIIFKQPFTQKIGKLEVDITSSRNISEKVSVTNNPIEGGFNTDNVKDEPTEIVITGIISKFSLKNSKIKQITTLASGDIPNRLKEAHDELYRIKNEKEPITLVMKFKSYSRMILANLDMPNDANDGETFRFTAIFKETRIAESQLVSLDNSRIKTDSAKKQSSFGRQVGDSKNFTPPSKISLGQFIKSLF